MTGRIRARADRLSSRIADLEAGAPAAINDRIVDHYERCALVLGSLVRYFGRDITREEAIRNMVGGGVQRPDADRYLSIGYTATRDELMTGDMAIG